VKKLLFLQIFLLAFYVGFETLCFGGIFLAKHLFRAEFRVFLLSALQKRNLKEILRGGPAHLFEYHASLGWVVRRNMKLDYCRINGEGIRATKEYALIPPEGILRVAAVGDSFVAGARVVDESIWTSRLETACPGTEVLNFGVGGYGMDQTLLSYRLMAKKFYPHVVLIGFVPQTVHRNVSRFFPFYHPNATPPLGKPRFVLEGQGLKLLENPLTDFKKAESLLTDPESVIPGITRGDYFACRHYFHGPFDILPSVRLGKIASSRIKTRLFCSRPGVTQTHYQFDSESFEIVRRLFQLIRKECLEAGSLPVIILFPTGKDLRDWQEKGIHSYAPLVRFLRQAGYSLIDIMEAFISDQNHDDRDFILPRDGHYTPYGNELVARTLEEYLETRLLSDPEGLGKAVEDQRQSASNQTV